MKNLILVILLLTISFYSKANDGYVKAMSAAIEKMYSAREVNAFIDAANSFDRIAAVEKDEWLPSYYAAFCYSMLATKKSELEKADIYLDKADAYLLVALEKGGDEVEILVMQAFSSMMRISVDPATRGQEFSMKAAGYLQQASMINSDNPRVMLMMGQLQFGTAQFFGAGTEEPCNTFKKSIILFEEEAKADPGINPSWGKDQALSMLKNCKG